MPLFVFIFVVFWLFGYKKTEANPPVVTPPPVREPPVVVNPIPTDRPAPKQIEKPEKDANGKYIDYSDSVYQVVNDFELFESFDFYEGESFTGWTLPDGNIASLFFQNTEKAIVNKEDLKFLRKMK